MAHFTVKGTTLLEAISWSAKGLTKKSAIEHSLITGKLEGSKLTLTSRSSDEAFNATILVTRSGSDQGDDSFVVQGDEFQQVITHLKSEDVRVDISKLSVVTKGARSRFEIAVVAGASLQRNFPQIKVGTVLAGAFKDGVTAAAIAAAGTDEPIEILKSIKIEFYPEEDKIRLVGCDRYQLIYREIEYSPSPGVEKPADILIPGAALKNLVAKIPEMITVDIMCEADNVFFGLESDELDGYSRSSNLDYIPYHKMLEATTPKSFTCQSQEMEHAIQTVSSMRENANHPVIINVKGSVATVKTTDARSVIEVDIVRENEDEDDVLFSFMPRFLTNALRSATSEVVRWKYAEKPRSAVFESLIGVNKEVDDSIRFVVAAHLGR